MKIKVAILDDDKVYLSRLVNVFNSKYFDKVEVYSFTDREVAFENIKSTQVDVFISSDTFQIDTKEIPNRCGFVYFVSSAEIEEVNGVRAICKFQKIETIYKQILDVFSEVSTRITGRKLSGENSTSVITFASAGCGTGATTCAVACAMGLSQKNKKVLYLNLEQFSSTNIFFAGNGQYDFGDVIYSLKTGKSNLSLKLESAVEQDVSGVYFYSGAKMALDMQELDIDDLQNLLRALTLGDGYDCIVIDINFDINEKVKEILKRSSTIVFVSDGTAISNSKFEQVYKVLSVMDGQSDISVIGKTGILYNKFSNKTGQTLEHLNLVAFGGAPKIENSNEKQVVSKLLEMNLLEKVYSEGV